jgi:hypothetical protein
VDPIADSPTETVDYATLTAAYAGATVLVMLARSGDDDLRDRDVVPLGLAAFALAKLITKEKVESWIREPFVDELANGQRRPRGRRMRYAVGELLSCSRCAGAWTALALVGLRATRPRESKVVTLVLGATAVNDLLQVGFTRLCADANLTQQRLETTTTA